MAVAAEPGPRVEVTPSLETARAARARAQPRPGPPHVRGGLRDARLRVPEAARPTAPRSCSSRPSRARGRPLVVHRLQAAQRAALEPRRRGRPVRARRRRGRSATARRRCRAGAAAVRGRRGRLLRLRLVRAVERLAEPNPDELGLPDCALMLTDVLVAFDHLKHTVTILANAYVDEDGGVERSLRARRRARCAEVRERLAGPLPRAAADRPAQRARRSSPSMSRAAVRGDRRAHRRVRARGRRLPGRPLAALDGGAAVRAVLDLPRPAGGQPLAVHVLPRLRATSRSSAPRPSRCSPSPGAARPRARSRGRARAARTRRRTPPSPPTCSPTRRSAPST